MTDTATPRSRGRPRQPAAVYITYNEIQFNQAAFELFGRPERVHIDFDVATHQIRIIPADDDPTAITIKWNGGRTPYIHAAALTALLRVYNLPAIRPTHYAVELDGSTLVLTPPDRKTLYWRSQGGDRE